MTQPRHSKTTETPTGFRKFAAVIGATSLVAMGSIVPGAFATVEQPADDVAAAVAAVEPEVVEEPAPAEAPVAPEATAESGATESAAVDAIGDESVAEEELLAYALAAPSNAFWPYDYETVYDPMGNEDGTVYTGGSKEDDPDGWKGDSSSSATGDGDIGNTYVGLNTQDELYVGFERMTANGKIGYFLELNQMPSTLNDNGTPMPVRTDGDLRLIFHAHGDAFSAPQINVWENGKWMSHTAPAGSYSYQVAPDGTLVEFKFDLGIILNGGQPLECGDLGFQTLFLRSGASDSWTSQLRN